jgi:hypothetical protein
MVSAQLSLFDTAAVIKPIYKVGDRVRVKRKTPHAPLLKKGDIVQIEAIHPHNGSCKFWNERPNPGDTFTLTSLYCSRPLTTMILYQR